MIDDLANYLATNNLGVLGQTLFEFYMPDQKDNAYMIKDTGGPAPDAYLPTHLGTFQVITRNASEPAGKIAAAAMGDFLHRTANKLIGSTYFYYILALQQPGSIGKDNSGRYEWTQNFLFLQRG